MKVLCKGIDVN